MKGGAIVAILVAIHPALSGTRGQNASPPPFPPPGKLIDMGGKNSRACWLTGRQTRCRLAILRSW